MFAFIDIRILIILVMVVLILLVGLYVLWAAKKFR